MTNEELKQIANWNGDNTPVEWARAMARELLDRRASARTQSKTDRPLRAQLAATLFVNAARNNPHDAVALADAVLAEVDRTAKE